MGKKTNGVQRGNDRDPHQADTATYEQTQGTPDPDRAPNESRARMPHERDESASASGNRLDQPLPPSGAKISQAHKDVERGLVDTERRGIPDDIPNSDRNRGR